VLGLYFCPLWLSPTLSERCGGVFLVQFEKCFFFSPLPAPAREIGSRAGGGRCRARNFRSHNRLRSGLPFHRDEITGYGRGVVQPSHIHAAVGPLRHHLQVREAPPMLRRPTSRTPPVRYGFKDRFQMCCRVTTKSKPLARAGRTGRHTTKYFLFGMAAILLEARISRLGTGIKLCG